MRLRPPLLAAYSAWSARASAAVSSSPVSIVTTPMLTVMR
jgi:hypothetical protein